MYTFVVADEELICSNITGTVFLWIFWPSFNGGAASGDEQHRAIVNTYLSLCACTIMTFAVSQVVDKNGRFSMVIEPVHEISYNVAF